MIERLLHITRMTTRELGFKVGLSGGSISAISTGLRKESKTLTMLCRYKFWKELEIPEYEICQELGLSCGDLLRPGEKEELNQRIEEMKQRETIYLDTIKTLNDQLKARK